MKKYRTAAFVQGEEADEILSLLFSGDYEAAFYLLWCMDYGEGGLSDSHPWGNADRLISVDRGGNHWMLSYSDTYAALTNVL